MHDDVCLLRQLVPIVCLVRLAIIPIVISNPIFHELFREGLLTVQLDLLVQGLDRLFYALSGLQGPPIYDWHDQLAWRSLLIRRD